MSLLIPGNYKTLFSLTLLVFILTIALLIYTYSSIISHKDREITTLRNTNDFLERELGRLNDKISELTQSLDSCRYNFSILKNESEQLSIKLDLLREQNEELSFEIARISSENAFLRERIDRLLEIIELKKYKLLSNKTLVYIEANNYTMLQYSIEYPGYLTINFTSNRNIYFVIRSSFDESIYQIYPTSGATRSGSFIAPVLPGTVYIYIHNASEYNTTVLLTIGYCW